MDTQRRWVGPHQVRIGDKSYPRCQHRTGDIRCQGAVTYGSGNLCDTHRDTGPRWEVFMWTAVDGGCWSFVKSYPDEGAALRHAQEIGATGRAATVEMRAG